MDIDENGILEKAEIDAILQHVPHEECLFGFMVSSDLDGDHVLNEEEWMEAFKHVGGEYFNLLSPDRYSNEFDICIEGLRFERFRH